MLDLTKLAQQMQGISQHLTQEATATRQRLELAEILLEKAFRRQNELVALQQSWSDRLIFTAATPIEPLNLRVSVPVPSAAHTVIATDGSQIAPSHHEIAYCYLINVGRIILYYGQTRSPLLDSLPEVFYRPEDLYISRQWGIRTEEWMGYRRTVSEAVVLAELGQQIRDGEMGRWASVSVSRTGDGEMKRQGSKRKQEAQTAEVVQPSIFEVSQTQNSKLKTQNSSSPPPLTPSPPPPLLALTDGSLIYWFLESLPAEARDRILLPILQAWDQLRQADIPLVGYLSASRSGEALNFLRLQACPYETPDCTKHCVNQNSDRTPCQVTEPLKDSKLWAIRLEPGQRSPFWRSSAQILDLYGDHRVYFCYLHVGTEVARVEVPEWVVENSRLLDTALSLTLAQVQKGYGYPVALAEAHNQAVVRGGDRARFFAFLEQEMIRAGLRNVGVSYKEARKRGSIA